MCGYYDICGRVRLWEKAARGGARPACSQVYIYCAVTVKATVELCTTLPAVVEATPVTVT